MAKSPYFKEYIDILQRQGGFLLGEPLVRYKISGNKEQIAFFLNYNRHGIHSIISEIILTPDKTKLNNIFALTLNSVSSYQILTLKEAKKLLGNRVVLSEENNITQSAMKITNVKELSFHIGNKVLKQDVVLDRKKVTENIALLQHLIVVSQDDILEKSIYLSRFPTMEINDLEGLAEMPLNWLTTLLKPSSDFQTYTIPALDSSKMQANRVYVENVPIFIS